MIVNANWIVQFATHMKSGITELVNVNVKIIVHAKKDDSWNLLRYICENSKHLKSIADTNCCEYCINKKTMARNVTSTASINCHNIKVTVTFRTQFYWQSY